MQVATRGCERSMSQCCLNKVNWCIAVQRMRSMRMSEPVTGDLSLNPRSFSRFANDSPDLCRRQMTLFSAAENRLLVGDIVPK